MIKLVGKLAVVITASLLLTTLLSVKAPDKFRVFVIVSSAKDHVKMVAAARPFLEKMAAENAKLEEAHALAAREARLEHARMGRSVCESRDGKVVWLTPEEVFAQYGLDEHGKPKA